MQIFVSVARNKSYNKAATAIHLSQPAITANIQELERRLGVRLLDRTTKHVRLTNEGEEFYGAVERFLDDLDIAIKNMESISEKRRGRLTIACLPSVAVELVSPAARKFAMQYPAVAVRILDGNEASVIESVHGQKVDFGVSGYRDNLSELVFTPLARDYFAAVFEKSHPLAHKSVVRLEDVCVYPFIVMGRMTGIRQKVDHATIRSNVRLNVVSEAEQISTVLGLVRNRIGVSILPESCASLSAEDLVFKRLTEPEIERDLGLITRKGRKLPPSASQFLEMVRDEIRALDELYIPAPQPKPLSDLVY